MKIATVKERVMQYLDVQGIKLSKFYTTTGLKRGLFDSDKLSQSISDVFITKIIANYSDINLEWLLTGKGEMLKESTEPIKAVAHVSSNENGLPLIPVTAFAGFGLATFDDLQIEHFYDVPDFKQADFLIRMKGNSMYPKYSSGDIIACAIVKETLFFQWNKIYAVLTNSQGVLIKRVKKSTLPDNILMFSDNAAYDPFDVPIRDILKIALVIGSIRVE